MLYLSDSEVENLVTTEESIECLEAAFRRYAAGNVAVQPRIRTEVAGIKLSTLGAIVPAIGYAGTKVYTTVAGRFSFVLVLFNTQDGAPLAVMSGNALTKVRTAALTAVAVRRLASAEARVLTIFGSGVQAQAHALAVPRVRGIREVRVVSRTQPAEFLKLIGEQTGARAFFADATEAVPGADIVVTATRAKEPLFSGRLLSRGSFVAAIGSSLPNTRELDDETMRRAGLIVVECLSQTREEAGDLILADKGSAIDWSRVRELGEMLVSPEAAPGKNEEIVVFKSVGFGLEDVALAALAYEKARESRGLRHAAAKAAHA